IKKRYFKSKKKRRAKKIDHCFKKSDYDFGHFSSAQIAIAIFVRGLYALNKRYAPQGFSN
ncbi:hypothetical protein, partial [Campylobacter concisus]|uniref:hypothetical protein n=1 Tax=Campylobacter concisus TaxID=199 RepID=UPI001CA4A545